jgi:hypothetical protein
MESTFGAPDSKAKEAVAIPAILLMIAAVIGIVFALFVIAVSGETAMKWVVDNPNVPQELRDQIMNSPRDSSGRLFYGFQAVLSAFVFFGALKMKNLQSYGLSMAAAIVACLPICGPCCGCISIPLGIWSLIVLNQADVKQAFR